MKRNPASILIAALILLSGCSLRQETHTLKPSLLPARAPGELIALIENRNRFTESLTGRLSSKILTGKEKKSSTQLILLKKPSHVRIDVLTPFGSPALTMATDGRRVNLHYHSKKRYFSGNLEKGELSTLFASALSMKDLATILGGGIPLISYDKEKSSAAVEGNYYRLEIKNGSARQEIFFEPESLAPAKGIIYGADGRVVMALDAGGHEDVQGLMFPMKMMIKLPVENYEMKISYSSVALNDYTGMDAFRLAVPEDAVIEDVARLNL